MNEEEILEYMDLPLDEITTEMWKKIIKYLEE